MDNDTFDENGATISRKYSKNKTDEVEDDSIQVYSGTQSADDRKSSFTSSFGTGHENLKERRERIMEMSQETPKFDDPL